MLDGARTKHRTAATAVVLATVPALALAAIMAVVLAAIDDEPSELPTMSIFQLPVSAEWSVDSPSGTSDAVIERTYDLADLVDSIAADKRADALERLRYSLSAPGQPAATKWADLESGQLIVTGSESVHEHVAELVNVWRTHGMQGWFIEVRGISVPRSMALPLGSGGRIVSPRTANPPVPARPSTAFTDDEPLSGEASVVTTQGVPLYLEVIDEAKMRQIIDLVQGDEDANIMFAPKLVVLFGGHSTVVSGTQRPFVTGLESLGWSRANPRVDTIQEGQVLDVHVMPGADPKSVQLECRIDVSQITDVVTVGVPGAGQPTVVQVPSVKRVQLFAAANLAVKETLLLAPLEASSKDNATYYLITVRAVEE